MIKNVLSNIGGIEAYGVISVCLFFTVFTVAILLALRMKRSVAQRMGALPLDDAQPVNQENSHE